MKRQVLIPLVLIAALTTAYFLYSGDTEDAAEYLTTTVTKGKFEQRVFASGELKAKKSLKVRGPDGMRSAGIWQTSIKDLITEGTYVKKGDYIGSLDKTELATKIEEITTDIEKEETKLEQIKIDTAIQLKEVQDEIADVIFNMKQERLEIEKNFYEPDMVIEQSKLKLQKSERSLDQLEDKSRLLQIQSMAQVKEVVTNMKSLNQKLQLLLNLSAKFSIVAPEDGMLIYSKTWNGKKGPGSQISSWDPVVAELPDLSNMISVGYVNEVDISKITKGQIVGITVDAFPEKEFTGQIVKVANIGQELKNQDAKVFEITIDITEKDDVLKPAMSTSNNILIYEFEDLISIPLEAMFNDSIDFVFKKVNNKIVKQEIVTGPFNEDNIIVLSGIINGDEVILNKLDGDYPIEYISVEVKEQAEEQIQSWLVAKTSFDKENLDAVKDETISDNQAGASGGIVIFN